MTPASPSASVLDTVATWPGVTTRATPRGATAVMFHDHELGHVHPDRGTLDLPLPDDLRADVLRAGRANEWFSDWVSKPLGSEADAEDGIALLRQGYDELRRR
jgi:luciferase-like monooxygenase